ncbi:MAG: tetratricopeptide repeat protein [Heliobacteriaceae bacterium]|jgi:tetratricopeptide (TPR) repeat protein|nr:tetratricopeptide repeat protein [Heliobacteriaceae bacterium]
MKRLFYLMVCSLLFALCAAAEENIQINALYAQNNIDKALDLLISVPEEKRTPQDYLLLGNILQDKGKNGEAIFMYNRAILADKKYYKAYYNLGVIYLQEEKPNLAISQFKQVIKLNPEFAYAHFNLGCAYIKTGELKKAKNEFLRAIELKNTVPDFHYNLAYAYKKLNKEKSAKLYLGYYNKLMENQ